MWRMELPDFEDKLELLGLITGVFIVVTGLGTLAGAPWSTADGAGPAVIQVAGVFLLIALGVAIVLFTHSEDPEELLPIEN